MSAVSRDQKTVAFLYGHVGDTSVHCKPTFIIVTVQYIYTHLLCLSYYERNAVFLRRHCPDQNDEQLAELRDVTRREVLSSDSKINMFHIPAGLQRVDTLRGITLW